jgi:hypothetical protein
MGVRVLPKPFDLDDLIAAVDELTQAVVAPPTGGASLAASA